MQERGRLVFTLLVLLGINTMNFYDRQVLGAVAEPVRKEWDLSDRQLSALTIAFILLYAAVGVPLGHWADVGRRRLILAAGVLLWSVLTALSGLAWNFASLFVLRLGVGVGEASCAPAANSLLGDLFGPLQRARAIALFMLGLPLGLGLSYLVSGWIAHELGWRAALFVAATPGLLLGMLAFWLAEPPRGAAEVHRNAGPSRGSAVLAVLRIPTMWWIILSGALLSLSMYALGSFLTSLLMRYHGRNIAQANTIIALVYGFGGGLGMLVGGWFCDRVGGFTGGNMERPALQRLLTDIRAGKIDSVISYKVDRLSRSLLDFAKMMETFEQHGVSFVSVTQQFNTATSMGRLVLNVLLSFAQFEREIIAERTRDKMAATRRKGKWSGGTPVLGYDLDPRGRRLHVNDKEATRVRAIFALYLEHQTLLSVAQELARRGWVAKRWQTRDGRPRGGRPFDKTSLYRLLTNVLYAGKVRYKDEIHDGEQAALIDADTFGRVQALLRSHGPQVGPPRLQRFSALLKGLLRCQPCDCAMTPSHTTRKGGLRYRYYTCIHAQKNGWQTCPSKSIPAAPIEQLVVEQIQRLGRDPLVLEQMLTQVRQQDESRVAEWDNERVSLERDLLRGQSEVRKLLAEVGSGESSGGAVTRLAELQTRLAQIEQRLARLRGQMEALQQERLDEAAATEALSRLVPAWEAMTPDEQARVVRLLVSRVDYDGNQGKASITFQPLGLKTLAVQMLAQQNQNKDQCA